MPNKTSSANMGPAGLQSMGEITKRRLLVLFLNSVTYIAFSAILIIFLGQTGWGLLETGILICFLLFLPWTVLGFWNALIGLYLLHGSKSGLYQVAPYLVEADTDKPLRLKTAIVMTLRNEDPARAFARLHVIYESLELTGEASQFAFFVLSDSDNSDIVAREQALFTAWKGIVSRPDSLNYRRRLQNTGFKAGNIVDFCERWGHEYAYMLTLDADSLMDGQTIVRMVRILQAYPKLGILQSLVVGAPARSPFARLFQFGMRAGMRAYTMGQAWWTADCGPYWGHNAMVRVAAFSEHCHLPELSGRAPFGGAILSHDQVEAALMRKGGYEVRVLPLETGSYEDNPTNVIEFLRRDARWCQGNLQYFKLVLWEGLLPVSRFQLIWAILMFLGLPAFVVIQPLIVLKAIQWQYETDLVIWPLGALYAAFLLASLAPKFVGYLDVFMSHDLLRHYGDRSRFLLSVMSELAFSFLLGAITTVSTSVFMASLLIGKSQKWIAQSRDAGRVHLFEAVWRFWPHTLFGLALFFYAWPASPLLVIVSLPLTLGFLLAIPFAVFTAQPEWGSKMRKSGLGSIPEEIDPPQVLEALSLLGPDRHRT
jgi:membrane glycosyltransferase